MSRLDELIACAALAAAACGACERRSAELPSAIDAGAIRPKESPSGAAAGETGRSPALDADADAGVADAADAGVADAGAGVADAADADASDAAGADASEIDCAAGDVRAGRSVGHTSVVFELELSNGRRYAYKPDARKVKGRYRGEIAAYRLARALGLPNVPPACLRSFGAAALARALDGAGAKLLASDVVVEDGEAKGALIPWIDGLASWPVERAPLRSDVRRWLTAGAAIPADKVELARQASTLVAFDHLTGNWDRYSGGNVGIDRDRQLVLYVDNDAAFMAAPPPEGLRRNRARLDATDRFSRSLVAAVRALDEEAIAERLGEGSPGEPLVSRAVVSLVARRAKELVAVVDAKTAERGEDETLFFR